MAMLGVEMAAALSGVIWTGLLLFWGGFWRADQRLGSPRHPARWPEVAVVIPARDEAAQIAGVIRSHGLTGYRGVVTVILVDDGSSDGTAEIARQVPMKRPLHIIDAPQMPAGWTGKLWALQVGTRAISDLAPHSELVLLTDADIEHAPDTLGRLVAKAEAEGLALVSLMARLDARGGWGALLIPAFLFFFQKLYPFPWVNDPRKRLAGAAGGCVLLRRDALAEIGGIAAIKGALIDDCTLAAKVKGLGKPIWLGLSDEAVISRRDNRRLGSVWKMVARTAFTQLRYSTWLLLGSTLGMAVLYLAGPLAVVVGTLAADPGMAVLGLAAWALMAIAYRPTARFYAQPVLHSLSLPLAASFYMAMTLDSARRHWRGKGGAWKGRVYGPLGPEQINRRPTAHLRTPPDPDR